MDAPQVRTLLLTDIVDSTSLVERLGDGPAAALFRRHDRLVLDLQQRWRGRLIDRSDGLLLIFGRAVDGLGFALDYVRGLRELGDTAGQPLRARAGLHVGEVLIWENPSESVRQGAKPIEVEGLAKPLAGRLMAMARPGQVLVSAVAEPLAHRAARELGERGEQLVWRSWGRWKFKGVPEAQEVFEVGEPSLAPLRMPANSAKAWRDLPLWRRPAALVAEGVMVAAIALGAWYAARPQPAIAFNERDWVVIGDLRNLTGDPRMDDALQQAFRISLEQSRHVNILSDLKVRQTLALMQRPADAAVDRAVGSEIALRDGARALILPTVSEVGGRLRVSAEVVDPSSQTTVYALSADGRGADTALGSVDAVTAQLRGKLGEALQDVQANSQPLPEVSTSSLDALKAYALARQFNADGELDKAQAHLRIALQHDPQFASAIAAQGYVYQMASEPAKGRERLDRALALDARMTARERLHAVAFRDTYYVSPVAGLRSWQTFADTYPDDLNVASSMAQLLAFGYGDFGQALTHARQASIRQSDIAGAARYMEGIALFGLGRLPDARTAFQASRRSGFRGGLGPDILLLAALGDAAGAQRALEAAAAKVPERSQDLLVLRGLLAQARGDRAGALQAAAALRATPGAGLAGIQRRLNALVQQVAVADGGERAAMLAELRALDSLLRGEDKTAGDSAPTSLVDALTALAWLAVELGDAATLDAALAALRGVPDFPAAWPLGPPMLLALEAERARLAGSPASACAALQPALDQSELAMPLLLAGHDCAVALKQDAQQVALQRRLAVALGRAYMEPVADGLLQPLWLRAVTSPQRLDPARLQ